MWIPWASQILCPTSAHTLPKICKQWAITYGSRVNWIDTATQQPTVKKILMDKVITLRAISTPEARTKKKKKLFAACQKYRPPIHMTNSRWFGQMLDLLSMLQHSIFENARNTFEDFSLNFNCPELRPFKMKLHRNSIDLFVSSFVWHTLCPVDILMLPLKGPSRRWKWTVIRCVWVSVLLDCWMWTNR